MLTYRTYLLSVLPTRAKAVTILFQGLTQG